MARSPRRAGRGSEDSSLQALDSGERAAIVLAESISADLLLIDDRAGAILAQQRGLAVSGTLGVLDLASQAGLLSTHSQPQAALLLISLIPYPR